MHYFKEQFKTIFPIKQTAYFASSNNQTVNLFQEGLYITQHLLVKFIPNENEKIKENFSFIPSKLIWGNTLLKASKSATFL